MEDDDTIAMLINPRLNVRGISSGSGASQQQCPPDPSAAAVLAQLQATLSAHATSASAALPRASELAAYLRVLEPALAHALEAFAAASKTKRE